MKAIISFFITLIFVIPSYSQRPDIKFTHLNTNDGLSKSHVFSIAQDSKGFMWIGTADGLNKFDGYNFTVYKNKSSSASSITNNNIKDILEDKAGNLWIASYGGLNRYNRNNDNFIQYKTDPTKNSISNNNVDCLFEDSKGNLWVGTQDGLNLLDVKKNSFTHFKNNPQDTTSIISNEISDILEDSQGNLWIATRGGLDLMDKRTGVFSHYRYNVNDAKSISGNSIKCLYNDREGNLWIGTWGTGLNLMDKKTKTFTRFENDPNNNSSLSHNTVMCLMEDIKGQLWVGTGGGGLCIFDKKNKNFHRYQHDDFDPASLSSNSIHSIYRDNQNNMWVGIFSGGINFHDVNKKKFAHYKHNPNSQNGLNSSNIQCFVEDKDKMLWVGTWGGGLNLMDKNTGLFTHYKQDPNNKNSIGGDLIICLKTSNENNILAGTWGGGVSIFNKSSNTFLNYINNVNDSTSLSSDNIWCLHEDKQGSLWIGTYGGGLNLLYKGKNNFVHYQKSANNDNSINNNKIRAIYEDSKNNLWIAVGASGLDRFDRKENRFIHYTHKDDDLKSLSSNSIFAILEDKKGNLWVCTSAGLNRFDYSGNNFISYDEKDGIPSTAVIGILEDDHENLWLSSNRGIIKFNPKTKLFKNYTVEDGLQGNEFNETSAYKTSDGFMLFGGLNGFNMFHPDSIVDNTFVPPVVITDFQIFNKSVTLGEKDSLLKNHIGVTKEITLSYKQTVFSFEFAALNYTGAKKNQYAYKLEGFDQDWNYVANKHSATYTNLDPGRYIFKVIGSNNDGVWNKDGVSIEITITPPFWQTWWFRSFLAIIIIGSIFTWYRMRINAIKKQNESLEAQIKDRTAELKIQGEKLEILYSEMKDSIRAAQVIQQAIFPSENLIKKHIPEFFILNKPKDVVSGDFYWFDVKDNKIIIAAVDCTGHGVSGAFMSINAHHLLNQSIHLHKDLIASEVLNRLNEGIIRELHQQEVDSEVQDGMDIALCIIDKENKKLQYAGANNPLYILRDGQIIQIKANKFSIGLIKVDSIFTFTNNEVFLQEGDTIYIFSDGYADQIGGESGNEKIMYPKFRELLKSIGKKGMAEQLAELDKNLTNWRGSVDQLDDVLVIGLKI